MSIALKLDQWNLEVKQNMWLRLFTLFNRIALAIGFFAAGMVKMVGERFASGLSVNHPMGQYLEALHHTGYYYTFIGILQVVAALLLLIPRTATLGALVYFPIILNIFILSFAVRFDGSLLSAPIMVWSNLYLLCWDYDKIKFILPFKHRSTLPVQVNKNTISKRFPFKFFAGVVTTIIVTGFIVTNVFSIKPRNSFADCMTQFKGTNRTVAGNSFCDCIHNQGKPLDKSMEAYFKAPDDSVRATGH